MANMAFQVKAASQFQGWEDEIASLQASTERAHRDYGTVETSLRALQERQKQLGTNMRHAQDRSGAFQREGLLLQQEKERLQQQLKDERMALEALANELHTVIANDNHHKSQFCKEMETLNQELSDLLMQQEELRLQKFVTVPSVQELRAYFIENDTTPRNEADADTTASDNPNLSQLDESIVILQEAHQQYQTSQTQLEQLEKQVQSLREQFQKKGQDAGQVRENLERSKQVAFV
jgi:chromosome segregation ATPase